MFFIWEGCELLGWEAGGAMKGRIMVPRDVQCDILTLHGKIIKGSEIKFSSKLDFREITLDYLGRPNLIRRALKNGRQN